MLMNFLTNTLMAEAGEAEGGGAPAPSCQPEFKPAAQPAPQPAPQPQPEGKGAGSDKTPADDKPEPVQYAETGDATLDYVLGYVGSYGLGPDHPAIKAAQAGEFAQLEVELAKLDAKGYDKVLDLARRSYDGYSTKEQEKSKQTAETLHQIAGGEEQWAEVQSWAAENAEPEEKEVINHLLSQGGFGARVAGQFLTAAYRESTGTEFKGKPAASQDVAPKPAQQANTPITRRELAAEGQKLYRKYGNDYMKSQEYQALAKRLAR